MYRVFEALDELSAIVEEARGVPMTAGCVVPRGDVLELIDDIKDAIPGELDDAQDVLDARDSMLQDAKTHADSMVSSATTEAESILNHARTEADRILSDAKAQADRMVSEARQHSERMVADAREEAIRIATAAKREYEASVSRAQAECDRLIENGNISYEKAVQEGIKEQQRLVSQNEVVAAANAESTASSTRRTPRRTGYAENAISTSTTSSPNSRNSSTAPCGPLAAVATSSAQRPALTTTRCANTIHRRKDQAPANAQRGVDLGGVRRRISLMARQHGPTAQRHVASPMTVDIARLGRRPGAMFELHDTVHSPARIGLELIAIDQGALLDLDLRVESVSEGVLVTGTVAAPTVGECARCLSPVRGRVQVALTELFAYPDSATDETTEEDEVGRVVDETIDLEQPIIDAVGLELPFSPVCRPDCPGLCPQCGVPLASEPGHRHEQIDPRWAKLVEMLGPESDTLRGER